MPREPEFLLESWKVRPDLNRIESGGTVRRLEPKVMDLLVYLSRHRGEVLPKERLLQAVWPDTFVSEGALTTAVFELRKAFEDDPAQPRVIETIPRRGYRLMARVSILDEEPSCKSERSSSWARRWPFAAGMVVGLALLIVPVAWVLDRNPSSPSSTPGARPTVLIAQLDNRTGDELLDGTLDVVLEGRLNDSGRVQLVSRPRVERTLALMRWPLDAILTSQLACEVSQRDGDVDFVLTGLIDGLGSRYHLTLRLLDGHSQELLASNDLGTHTREGLLDVADAQAAWLLDRLGIEKPKGGDQPPQVTTRSLEALSLYVKGLAAYRGAGTRENLQRNIEAAQLFEEAARLDPEFASAHLMLAWSRYMLDQANPELATESEVVYRPATPTGTAVVTRRAWNAMERAVATRERASLMERAFIQGCYFEWKGEPRRAAAYYRLTADLQPEHRWAAGNLMRLGTLLKDRTIISAGLLALSSGQSFEAQGGLLSFTATRGELEAAGRIRDRIAELAAMESDGALPEPANEGVAVGRSESIVVALAFDVWSLWRQGKYPEAEASLETLAQRIAELGAGGIDFSKAWIAQWLTYLHTAMGRLDDAREAERRYDLSYRGGHWGSWLSSLAAGLAILDESAEQSKDPASGLEPWYFFPGMFPDRAMASPRQVDSLHPLMRELVSIVRLSRTKERIAGLEALLAGLPWHIRGDAILDFGVRWGLAREHAKVGRQDEAIAVLEGIVADKDRTFNGAVMIWQKAALDLARLYLWQDRLEEAELLQTELAEMLQFADADHPILRDLESLRRPSLASRGEIGR